MSAQRRILFLCAVAVSLIGGTACGVMAARFAIDQKIAETSVVLNGWRAHYPISRFGSDYLLRAAAAQGSLGAHPAEESLSYLATSDQEHKALDGRSHYVLHFPAGALPPVGAFWTLSCVNHDDFRLSDNALERRSIGDRTKGLTRNPDGSLDIFIQNDEPDEGIANWLPCPPRGFILTLRVYEPAQTILDRRWAPPPIRRQDRLA